MPRLARCRAPREPTPPPHSFNNRIANNITAGWFVLGSYCMGYAEPSSGACLVVTGRRNEFVRPRSLPRTPHTGIKEIGRVSLSLKDVGNTRPSGLEVAARPSLLACPRQRD